MASDGSRPAMKYVDLTHPHYSTDKFFTPRPTEPIVTEEKKNKEKKAC